jgi:hypothetical protein
MELISNLSVAFREIRKKFDENRNVLDEKKIKKLRKVAEDADIIIRTQVVQAWQKVDRPDTYGKQVYTKA